MVNPYVFCLFWHIKACGKNTEYDYTITGQVESIAFGSRTDYPCYIAMSSETDGQPSADRRFYYHKVNSIEMCKFAERCRAARQPIIAYCLRDSDQNRIYSVQYADTKARWW